AEYGIRVRNVTGVQTCALPILTCPSAFILRIKAALSSFSILAPITKNVALTSRSFKPSSNTGVYLVLGPSSKVRAIRGFSSSGKIRRGECRGRDDEGVVARDSD